MAKKEDRTEDQLANVEQALGKTEQFIENNRKMISYVIIGIIVLVLAILGYFKYISGPKEIKAFNTIHYAEKYFEQDSFLLALNGDGVNSGFLEIIDDFGRTKSGNLAKYYAGISYLNLAMLDTNAIRTEYLENSIKYLNDFSSDDELVMPMALGAMGDAYDELGDPEKAIDQYKKATEASDNEFTKPLFLLKMGMMYSALGKHDKALETFEIIKNDFYNSNEGGMEIKKRIAYEKTLLGK
jgi:tetratricopeptide (TPR) repeat protein